MAAAERRQSLATQGAVSPLTPGAVSSLVSALAPHTSVLSDIPRLVGALADEEVGEVRGQLATAHLALLLAAAMHRWVGLDLGHILAWVQGWWEGKGGQGREGDAKELGRPQILDVNSGGIDVWLTCT